MEEDEFKLALAKAKEESLRIYKEVELPCRPVGTGEGCSKDNVEISDTLSQVNILYKGKEADGFHLAAGKTYVYPSNYALRKYQADVVPTALFHNTLVCLPTGLGKTFIAAVVMYNFYRWYPMGKIIFMAPTRPLVTQQMNACRDIMAIPDVDTIEMTGSINPQERQQLWIKKRVLYLTPQVMINDLRNNMFNPLLIKCLVIDEAHRATKGYAYCQVVQTLFEEGVVYRILALSATPGSDIKAVKEVIQNLYIEKLEVRSEDSADVSPYTHDKLVDKIVVELPPYIKEIWNQYLQVYDNYLRRIRDMKVLIGNITTMSKFQVLMACRKFMANPPSTLPKNVVQLITADFNVCVSLAHARELLQLYGIRAFYNYFIDAENSREKSAGLSRLCHDSNLKRLLNNIENLILKPVTESDKYIWSHPKFENLVDVVKKHFKSFEEKEENTKAIIFCQFRSVVSEVHEILQKFVPDVKPVMFIGQGNKDKRDGITQKKQIEIMKKFRSGEYNVLIATCVAEEGLDIGDVDLLILMESHRSPVRLVQRLGRTGRHKKGRCVVLLSKGYEEKRFYEGMTTRKNYMNIMNSPKVAASLQKHSPRMIPASCHPKRQMLHVKVPRLKTPGKKGKSKQSDIRQVFGNLPVSKDNVSHYSSPFLNETELEEVKNELGSYFPNYDRLPPSKELWHRRYGDQMNIDELTNGTWSSLAANNDWNSEYQKTYVMSHSKDTDILVHVLNKAHELKTGKKIDCIMHEPRHLWSIVGPSKVLTKNDECNSIIRCDSDIKNCLATTSKNTKANSHNKLQNYKLFNSFTAKENSSSESYNLESANNDEIHLINDNIKELSILEDNMSNLLNRVLKNFENTFNEFNQVCVLEKNVEISDCLEKYMVAVSKTVIPNDIYCLSTDLLNDITVDDINNFNINDILNVNLKKDKINYVNKENTNCDSKTERFSPVDFVYETTPLNIIGNLQESSDSVSEVEFVDIDDLLDVVSVKNSKNVNTDFKSLPVVSQSNITKTGIPNCNYSSINSKNPSVLVSSSKQTSVTEFINKKSNNNAGWDKEFVGIDDLMNTFGNDDFNNQNINDKVTQPKSIYENHYFSYNNENRIDVPNNYAISTEMKKLESNEVCCNKDFVDIDDILKSNSCNKNDNEVDLALLKKPLTKNNNEECLQKKDSNIQNSKTINNVNNTFSKINENKIDKELKTETDNIDNDTDSSLCSLPYILGTPKKQTFSTSLLNQTSDTLNEVINEFEKCSPILSGSISKKNEIHISKNNLQTDSNNLNFSTSPILTGRYTSVVSQIKCSTPIVGKKKKHFKISKFKETVDQSGNDNIFQCNEKKLNASFEDLNKSKKKLFRNDNLSSSDCSDYNEPWTLETLLKDITAHKNDNVLPCKSLSYYLNGDSMYTITQLVEKAEELENNNNKSNKINHEKQSNMMQVYNKDDTSNRNKTTCVFENIKKSNDVILRNEKEIIKNTKLDRDVEYPQTKQSIPKQRTSDYMLWDSSEDDIFANIPPTHVSDEKITLDNYINNISISGTSQLNINASNEKNSEQINQLIALTAVESDSSLKILNTENCLRSSNSNTDKNLNDYLSPLFSINSNKNDCMKIFPNCDSKNYRSGSNLNLSMKKKSELLISKYDKKINDSLNQDNKFLSSNKLVVKKDDSFTSEYHETIKSNFCLSSTKFFNKNTGICELPNKSITSEGSYSKTHSSSKSVIRSDSTDSDSDIFIQTKKVRKRLESSFSDISRERKLKKSNREIKHVFIDREAEVSGETSSGAETSGLDTLDDSFIDDFSQKPEVSMYKKYAEAVKNTDRAVGGFKIPMLTDSVMERDVYSQAAPIVHESYVNDSFCVKTSNSDDSIDEISYLERAEQMLATKMRIKKKLKTNKKKRKRLKASSDSDETDFEGTRYGKNVSNNEDDCLSVVNHKFKKRRIISSDSD
ncbi:FA complementation group M [Lycorma delicatula]|uniref:FA complementation group M n=1 Tax=Lycorma delicatula TaxID=130591 RepID=UPI003F514634